MGSVPLSPMSGYVLLFVGMALTPLRAQDTQVYEPVFTDPKTLRLLQSQFDPKIPRVGPYGLPQPAAARFGWERVQSDSSFAFDAARTLWLDYFCLFGDSLCADWALIRSPREVRRSTPTFRWNELPVRSDSVASARQLAFQSRAASSLPADTGLRTTILEPTALPPGSALTSTPPKSAVPLKPSELRIVVRSGDNFGVLQRRYPGVTLKELYAANKGSDRIYPGQVLKIPR